MGKLGIAEKFDIDDIEPIEVKEEEFYFNEDYDQDVEDDYKFIRSKLRRSIAISEAILNQGLKAINIAPDAKSIDACSGSVKIMISAAKELQDMHEKRIKTKKDISKNENKEDEKEEKKSKYSLNDILDLIQERNK